MRDIYTHSIITSDFVLVMGDLVSNVRLDEVVRIHKERRKTNKDAIMTMVVKESGASHRTRYARTCLCNLLLSHLRDLCALKSRQRQGRERGNSGRQHCVAGFSPLLFATAHVPAF